MAKTEVKMRFEGVRRNPFARNEVRSPKTGVKLRFQRSNRNPFARNEVRSPKTEVNCNFSCPIAALSHEMRFDRQNRGKIAISRLSGEVCKRVCV